jgi:glucosamine--fructose-6-phosphate aminotransferase (isomerizing)
VASDASAVVEHTKNVVYLEDNDVVHVVGGAYGIFNVQIQVCELAYAPSSPVLLAV